MAVFADDIRLELITASALEPALLLPFDENTSDYSSDGHSPSTATGGIIFPAHITPQVGSGCVQLAEATTNLITNPSIEVNTTGYTGIQATLAQNTGDAYVGGACLQSTLSANYHETYFNVGLTGSTAGRTFSFQVAVKGSGDSIGKKIRLYLKEDGGAAGVATMAASSDITLSDQWQVCALTGTITEDDRTQLRAGIYTSTWSTMEAGDVFLSDAWQVEEKSYPTPYCDGSLGDGHSWSGAAHNSTSSRTVTSLIYDADAAGISETEGAFAAWVMLPLVPGDNTQYNMLFSWWDDWNTESIYLNLTADGIWNGKVYSGSVQQCNLSHSVADWKPFEWHHIVFVWKTNDCRLYIDGALEASDSDVTMPSIVGTALKVGGESSVSQWWNGWVDDAAVLDRALTDAEAAALYAAGSSGFAAPRILYDIYDDVAETVRLTYGIKGQQPNLRVASPGYLDFVLDNSENNSGALMGYYSPQYVNRRTGWGHGEAARLAIEYDSDTYYKFCGRITKIQPSTGKYGDLEVKCRAQDWIADAVYLTPTGLEVQATKRGDELLTELLAATTKQPPATDFDQGDQTFSYAFDEVRDGQTTRERIRIHLPARRYGHRRRIGI